MKATRFVIAALVAAAGLVSAAPDADAHGKRKNKHWKRGHHYEERHVRPEYRLVWKWTWDNYAREWRWIAVYEPIYYTQDRYPRHDHPFPEHDDHDDYDDHEDHDGHDSCRW